MVWRAVIGGGASLLGGIFSKPKTRSARDETRGGIMGQAQGAREAAEKYGFNPLTLLSASSPMGSQTGQNYMGAAIADAGMIVAEAMAKRLDAGQNSQLEAENSRLKQQIQQQTLRPKVGGVYALRETIPTISQQGSGIRASVSDTFGKTPSPIIIGDRKIEPISTANISGVFQLENPATGGPVNIPGDQEPWGLSELGTAVVTGVPQIMANWGRRLTNRLHADALRARGVPVFQIDGKWYAQEPDETRRGIYRGAKDFWLGR